MRLLRDREYLPALIQAIDKACKEIDARIFLIDRCGLDQTKRAARITARFKPNFALRNVHHTAGVLRNWAAGVPRPQSPWRRHPWKKRGLENARTR